MKTTTKKQPVHEIKIGALKATIWKNESPKGAFHSVTLSRIYKDGEKWASTSSFGRNDLLPLAKLTDQAHSWVVSQEAPKPVAK